MYSRDHGRSQDPLQDPLQQRKMIIWITDMMCSLFRLLLVNSFPGKSDFFFFGIWGLRVLISSRISVLIPRMTEITIFLIPYTLKAVKYKNYTC